MQKFHHYRRAVALDATLSSELERLYGAGAGDARYLRQTYRDHPRLERLSRLARRALDAHRRRFRRA
jgi:hypothetical protein